MKCPKCGYFGPDYLDNCRKCGKDLLAEKEKLGFIPSLRLGARRPGRERGQAAPKIFEVPTPPGIVSQPFPSEPEPRTEAHPFPETYTAPPFEQTANPPRMEDFQLPGEVPAAEAFAPIADSGAEPFQFTPEATNATIPFSPFQGTLEIAQSEASSEPEPEPILPKDGSGDFAFPDFNPSEPPEAFVAPAAPEPEPTMSPAAWDEGKTAEIDLTSLGTMISSETLPPQEESPSPVSQREALSPEVPTGAEETKMFDHGELTRILESEVFRTEGNLGPDGLEDPEKTEMLDEEDISKIIAEIEEKFAKPEKDPGTPS